MNNPIPENPPVAAPPPIDNRRRLRELLSIPERDRTDEQWDEIIELEIQLAPGNRITANDPGLGGGGGQHKPVGQQQKKHRPRNNNSGGGSGGGNTGGNSGGNGGGNSNNRRPRQHKPSGGNPA